MEITATKPKKGEFKTTYIDGYTDASICSVAALERYIEVTAQLRHPTANALFIQTKAPYKNCAPDTLGKWAEKILSKVGINTTAHKIRGAATTHALKAGVSLFTILEKANWRNSTTFKNHYWRPELEEPIVRIHAVNEEHSKINEIHDVSKFIQ